MTNPQVDRAADAFSAALVEWRARRGLSKKQLAAEMGFDPSYVSHVEARRHRPTEDFARRAEAVLRANGVIWQRFLEYDEARHDPASGIAPRPREGSDLRFPGPTGLVVEFDHAELVYHEGHYRCAVRRELFNAGSEPVTRYLVRIAVDRYPGEPERSNRHYRDNPLTWAELDLEAHCGDETMSWRPKHDRDAFKEAWLLFENDGARFPLYPGQRGTIEYAYTVGEDKWGHFFQRAVRLPTRRLAVRLNFPSELRPVVWGVETSLTAEAGPLRTPLTEVHVADRILFDWTTDDPPLSARFRLEWRFRGDAVRGRSTRRSRPERRHVKLSPSELMAQAGIVQRGAPMLDRAARWFELPDQAALAKDIATRLLDGVQRVAELHEFRKGLGLAAPQIGISWAAAVVVPPPGHDLGGPLVLLNPRIINESMENDQRHEGCLSFFDVRGLVTRALLIDVEHENLDGSREVTRFTDALARLVAHEIDHLGGLLYTDRIDDESALIPVEEYHDHGKPWDYADRPATAS